MQTAFDAIVIGAGPAGSSLATLLARAGWQVALLEQQDFPRRKVCGACIAASNFPLFTALGIWQQFDALAGPPLQEILLMTGEQTVRAALPALLGVALPWGRALEREVLDGLLLQQAIASGVHLLQPWKVRAVTGEPGNWRCRAQSLAGKNKESAPILSAPVLVAACGSWEPGPGLLPPRAPRADDLLAFKANFQQAALAPGVLPVLAFAGGYGGMVLGGAGITTIACCVRRDVLQSWRRQAGASSAGEAVGALLRQQCRGVRESLGPARLAGRWLAAGPLRPGVRQPLQAGPSRQDAPFPDAPFLIGNAAGEAHPLIGEGISMALQSAFLLADLLVDQDARTLSRERQRRLLQAYSRAWRAQFSGRLRMAAGLAHLAMRPALAPVLLAGLQRFPGMLTHAARWSGKARPFAMPASLSAMPVAPSVSSSLQGHR